MTNLTAVQKQTIKSVINKFNALNGASFVAVKGYESSTTGEVANHLINCNFSYGNAIEKDLNALNKANEADIKAIAETGNFTPELVKLAIAKLKASFEANKSKETASNQSNAQADAYYTIAPSIRLHLESGNLFIYGHAVNKQVLVAGTYKSVNSKELTLCQNSVKKYFNFTTSKFRQFNISPEQLSAVKILGEEFQLA